MLALVSKPSYDPNALRGRRRAPRPGRRSSTDEWRPLQNRAISGQYPPGSTYKAIVAAAALEEKVITPGRPGLLPRALPARAPHLPLLEEGRTRGDVDLHDALVESCDVYFYTAGLKLGIDRLAFFARGFRLGRRTGIALPNEQSGLVPTSAWKERRFGEPWCAARRCRRRSGRASTW